MIAQYVFGKSMSRFELVAIAYATSLATQGSWVWAMVAIAVALLIQGICE